MIQISRAMMRHWADGELLHYRRGQGFVVNQAECQAAQDALDAGETIQLTDADGAIVSEMKLVGGEYREYRHE